MKFYNKLKLLYKANTLGLAIKGQIGDYISNMLFLVLVSPDKKDKVILMNNQNLIG